jgi:hypothetical protein
MQAVLRRHNTYLDDGFLRDFFSKEEKGNGGGGGE